MNREEGLAGKEPAEDADRYIVDFDADEDIMDKVIIIEEEGE